jgi:hypothetical protein
VWTAAALDSAVALALLALVILANVWFVWRRLRRRPYRTLDRQEIRLVGDQPIGDSETSLLERLRPRLTDFGIRQVNLVRRSTIDGASVLLVIHGHRNARVVRAVSDEFRALFGRHEHLDITHLSPEIAKELARIGSVPCFPND